VDAVAFDIDVVEGVFPPDGAFSPAAACGCDGCDFEHGWSIGGGGVRGREKRWWVWGDGWAMRLEMGGK